MGVWCLHESFCPAPTFVTADSDEARKPQHFIYVNVSGHKKMKTTTLAILILILNFSYANAQTDCQKANECAKMDFKKSDFSFHSEEMLPVENTYFYVLKKYYNINWYFTDSLDYYACYDSVMIDLLKVKYGADFLQRARNVADSLDNTKNWRKDVQFPGGTNELFKFISSRLIGESLKMDSVKTKTRLIVQFEIDSTGKVNDPRIMRGINQEIDRKVIEIIKQLPNWEPAYLYGKPIRQMYTMPINIDYE